MNPAALAELRRRAWALEPATLDALATAVRSHHPWPGARAAGTRAAVTYDAGRSRSVAVVPISGLLLPRGSFMLELFGGTSVGDIAARVRAAAADPSVSTIILNVDSPGGSVTGIPEAYAAIAEAARRKRVVASVNYMAASAAYWLASPAAEIVASPSAEVGSIGVYCLRPDQSVADAKQGVKYEYIHAGKYKVEGNEHEPISDAERAYLQREVDSTYADFVSSVAKGRRASETRVRDGYGQGRLVSARDGLKLGIIDRIATFESVLQTASGQMDPGRERAMRAMELINLRAKPTLDALQEDIAAAADLERRRDEARLLRRA